MHSLELGLSASGRAGSEKRSRPTVGHRAGRTWWASIIHAFNLPKFSHSAWKGRGGQGERKIIYIVHIHSFIIPFTVPIPTGSVR